MKGVLFPLKAGEIDVEFRFGIRSARDLERAAGCNYQTLFARGQQIEAICLMTCFALRHQEPKLTVDKATDLVEAYVDSGGNIVTLYEALQRAMNVSGVYGPSTEKMAEDTSRPTTATAPEEATL